MRTLSLALLAFLASASPPAIADANSASATVSSTVFIAPPIKIEQRRTLWFGEVVVEAGLADRTIEQWADRLGGTRAPDAPGVNTVVMNYEPWHNAELRITGLPGACYSLCMPGDGFIQLESQSGGGAGNPSVELRVDEYNQYRTSRIDDAGQATVYVGGRLKLGSNPTPGFYHGQFLVTVAYN